MKKTLAVIMTMGLIGTMGMGTAWAGRISDRQWTQERRIDQGVRSGELTCHEMSKLNRIQYRIQRAKMRAWADGWLDRGERLRIERLQDRAGRKIYRLKHNDRWRY